jgi:ComEC/Rec2-related protein
MLRSRLAGEVVLVSGRIRPPPPRSDWFAVRHVVGRLDADDVQPGGAGTPPWRLGNRLRRTLVDGAGTMSPEHRSLFTGFVLGDDRDQPPELADDFRGSGLSHLLAVSGENVAFVLVLAGPLLRRLAFRGRWAVTLAVVCAFALVTRFEPSVLRASAMAAVAVTASCLGRQADALRVLSLAVTGLLLIDPFLVRSVGFQLSVAASAGIVLWSRRLAAAVPLPRVVAEAVGVTAAAQVGVAPILVTTFDGVPVVSVPANLLAGPAAGPVMMWGLSGGLLAGVLGEPWAGWLHVPTGWLVGWIEGVARIAARAPLGELGAGELAVVTAGGAGVLWGRRRDRRRLVRASVALVLIGMAAPAIILRTAVSPVVVVADGATVHRRGGATVVVLESARIRADDLLEGLRRAGVRRIDVLAVRGGGPATSALVAAVRHRWRPGEVLAPDGHAIPDARTPRPGATLAVGRLAVTVESPRRTTAGSALVVRVDHRRVASALPARARGPPAGSVPSVLDARGRIDPNELVPGLRPSACCARSCGRRPAAHGGHGAARVLRSVVWPPVGCARGPSAVRG